jgi:hypothetical protein
LKWPKRTKEDIKHRNNNEQKVGHKGGGWRTFARQWLSKLSADNKYRGCFDQPRNESQKIRQRGQKTKERKV